ncbi:MAG: hypothetical protein ACI8RC_002924, partial [Ilumatobacter sp.]
LRSPTSDADVVNILLERGFRGVPAGCFYYARHSRHQTSAFDPGVEH